MNSLNKNQDKIMLPKRKCYFGFKILIILVVFILESSCAILSQRGQTALTETLWSYQSAIRWGRYADALEFQKTPQNDFDHLSVRDVRVTSYRVEHKAFNENGDRLEQTVEIRYIREPGIVERTIFDKQNWLYDEETDGWVLDGKLPHFQ